MTLTGGSEGRQLGWLWVGQRGSKVGVLCFVLLQLNPPGARRECAQLVSVARVVCSRWVPSAVLCSFARTLCSARLLTRSQVQKRSTYTCLRSLITCVITFPPLGDLDLDPERGTYRLSATVPGVEVNQLRASLGVRPLPMPVAGAVAGTLHITGPLEKPIFSGESVCVSVCVCVCACACMCVRARACA